MGTKGHSFIAALTIEHTLTWFFETNYQQGRNDSLGVHCPMKTAPLECDIERRRSFDAPALPGKKAGALEPARFEGPCAKIRHSVLHNSRCMHDNLQNTPPHPSLLLHLFSLRTFGSVIQRGSRRLQSSGFPSSLPSSQRNRHRNRSCGL